MTSHHIKLLHPGDLTAGRSHAAVVVWSTDESYNWCASSRVLTDWNLFMSARGEIAGGASYVGDASESIALRPDDA